MGLGARNRRGAAHLPVERARRAGRDRRRGAPPGAAARGRASPGLAHGLATQELFAGTRRSLGRVRATRGFTSRRAGPRGRDRRAGARPSPALRPDAPSPIRRAVSVPARGRHQPQHRTGLGVRRGAGTQRRARGGDRARVALDPARPGAVARAGDRGDGDRGRALRGVLRPRGRAGDGQPRGRALHLGNGGGEPPSRGLRGRRGRRAR